MKFTTIAASAAAAILLGVMSSCGGNGNRETVEFENYTYDAVAEVAEIDSLEIEEGSHFWRCQGSGVLPVRIGKRDVKTLRDTLEAIAAVTFEKGDASPRLPAGYKPQLLDADKDKKETESLVINNLSVALVTPEVMVWQNYHYAYPQGAAHGVYSNTFINYSMADGSIITMDMLFRKGTEAELLNMVRARLSERDDLLVDVEDVELPDNYRITTDGVTFIYGLFAVAPYVSGEVEVSLNAYVLGDLLTEHARTSIFGMPAK